MIPLTKPNFIVGDEKRFLDFVSKLNSKEKTFILSHTSDLEGIASAKVVSKVINADTIKFINYSEFNDSLIEEIKKSGSKFLIVTDLYIKNKEFLKKIEEFAEVLIIDHHMFDEDWNSDKTVFLNARGLCATYLCYYLFSKIKDLEEIDWLVASASISDWCYTENAEWMKSVFEKYNQTYDPSIEGIKNNSFFEIANKITYSLIYSGNDAGKIYSQIGSKIGEIGEIEKIAVIIEKEISREIKKFNQEKKMINNRYFFIVESNYPLSSYVCTALSAKEENKTFIVGQKKDEIYKFSFRRQDRKEDMNLLSRKIVSGFENSDGGGHIASSGASILVKDFQKFTEKLEKI